MWPMQAQGKNRRSSKTGKRASVSIIEVAKIAGVSTSTVSRVLNELPNVRPEIAEQVRAAMESVGYTIPKVRRGPKSGPRNNGPRTGQIAVITIGHSLRWFELPIMGAMLAGVSQAAREANLRVFLEEMLNDAAPTELVRQRNIAGAIVFMNSAKPDEVLGTISQHVPVVWVANGEASATKTDQVSTDDASVGYLAYRYLQDQGCERLAYISADPQWAFMRVRGQSFANSAADEGKSITFYLRSSPEPIIKSYGGQAVIGENIEELVQRFAAAKPRFDGLFIPTDLLTSQVYPLLYRHGIKPGRDLKIISSDNEQIRLQSLTPRPATIDIGPEAIGRAAVRRLMRRIADPAEAPARIRIAPSVVLPIPAEED
jgi:DNA-binding LacI/PurR family transcriptional regulator